MTWISRSRHFLKSNIRKTTRLKDKVTIAQEESIPNYVWWPWLTSKRVARVCQHQLSFLLTTRTAISLAVETTRRRARSHRCRRSRSRQLSTPTTDLPRCRTWSDSCGRCRRGRRRRPTTATTAASTSCARQVPEPGPPPTATAGRTSTGRCWCSSNAARTANLHTPRSASNDRTSERTHCGFI